MIGTPPAFPPFSGTEQLPNMLKRRIAAVAWEKSAADEKEFRRLCVQHVRGDIDLFADNPAETDATPRVQAAAAQREIEASVAPLPVAAVVEAPAEAPAEEAAPIAGRTVPRYPPADRGE